MLLWLLLPMATFQNCFIPTVFNCSSPFSFCHQASSVVVHPQTVYNCSERLEITAEHVVLSGHFSSVQVRASNVSILQRMTSDKDVLIHFDRKLTISASVQIKGSLIVHSNVSEKDNNKRQLQQTNNSSQQTELNLIDAQVTVYKFVSVDILKITMKNSSIVTLFRACLYGPLNVSNISNTINYLIDTGRQEDISQLPLGVILHSHQIILEMTLIDTVSIHAVSLANFTINLTNINTTGRSCQTNQGQGRGTTIQYVNQQCSSGSSSCGFGAISNASYCYDIIQYFMFLSHSLPYINKGPYLSTGSGGYGYGGSDPRTGAGGGIIFILAYKELMIISSNLSASGGSVGNDDPLSAGSAGTIFMSCEYLIILNLSFILAEGGNSINNKGSGSGGLVKISFKERYNISQYTNVLWISIQQGIQSNSINQQNIYSNGIFYGVNCFPGQQANYLVCDPCPSRQYSALGDPVCKDCPKLSQVHFSQTIGNDAIYQCYKLKKIPVLGQWFTPGDLSYVAVLVYIVVLIILTIVGTVLKKRIKRDRLVSGDDFKIDQVRKNIEQAKTLALELRKQDEIKSYELMYHVHRISCFGNNSEVSPWILPLLVPAEVEKYVHLQVYKNFAVNFNEEARWRGSDFWLSRLTLLVYPVYWWWLDRVKKKKFKILRGKFQQAKEYNLLNNYGYEDRSILTLKLTKTKDYSNCYLDFFIYKKASIRYFTLSTPFLIYFAGQGSFLRPFYLQEDDIFYRMLFYVVSRNIKQQSQQCSDERSRLFSNMLIQKKRQRNSFEIINFIRRLNTIACTIDLAATKDTIIERLWQLFQYLDQWNCQFFTGVAVRVDLMIMISRLTDSSWSIDNDIQLPTTKDKKMFEFNINHKLEENYQFQHTIKLALVVYDPEQEIVPDDEEDQEQRQLMEGCDDRENKGQGSELLQKTIRKSLMHEQNINYNRSSNSYHKPISRFNAYLFHFRYYLLSHEPNIYDEYTIKFVQSLIILLQTMLVFLWSVKVAVPYPLVNLACPLLGVVLFVSDSYGLGKLYLILLVMTLLDQVTMLILYTILEAKVKDGGQFIIRNVLCSLVNIVLIVLMMFIGKRALTLSKKLAINKQEGEIAQDNKKNELY